MRSGSRANEIWKFVLPPGRGKILIALQRVAEDEILSTEFFGSISCHKTAGGLILSAAFRPDPDFDRKAVDHCTPPWRRSEAWEMTAAFGESNRSGRSLDVDRYRRSLGESLDFSNPTHRIVAIIPTNGLRTTY